MAANPDPARITDAMWRFWETCLGFIPGLRLGGIYANKSGYHNTVKANQSSWPGEYSTRLSLDTQYPPKDKARGIDLTMSTAEMTKRTGYLKRAAEHPDDDRLNCIREFIGTLDGHRVYCKIKDDDTGATWRDDWTRDSSHLWHEHISVLTKYAAQWAAGRSQPGLEAVASVLSGETWEAWLARKGGGDDTVWYAQMKDLRVCRANGATIEWAQTPQEWETWIAAYEAAYGSKPVVKYQVDAAPYDDGRLGKDITDLSSGGGSEPAPPTEVPDHEHEPGGVVRAGK